MSAPASAQNEELSALLELFGIPHWQPGTYEYERTKPDGTKETVLVTIWVAEDTGRAEAIV